MLYKGYAISDNPGHMEAALQLEESKQIVAYSRKVPEFEPLKPRQRRFLIAYCKTGRIQAAAEQVDVAWISHYRWIKVDEKYKQAFEMARQIYGDWAEGDVFDRAFVGKEVVKTRVGKDGSIEKEEYKQKSDVLAMFALKGLKPQYRDNFVINQVIGPTQLNVQLSERSALPPAQEQGK